MNYSHNLYIIKEIKQWSPFRNKAKQHFGAIRLLTVESPKFAYQNVRKIKFRAFVGPKTTQVAVIVIGPVGPLLQIYMSSLNMLNPEKMSKVC